MFTVGLELKLKMQFNVHLLPFSVSSWKRADKKELALAQHLFLCGNHNKNLSGRPKHQRERPKNIFSYTCIIGSVFGQLL